MSKDLFTPGPWTWLSVADDFFAVCTGLETIADTQTVGNARLIAAAPELLEALEAAIECGMVPASSAREGGATAYARQVQVADMIRNAIAKARGDA